MVVTHTSRDDRRHQVERRDTQHARRLRSLLIVVFHRDARGAPLLALLPRRLRFAAD